eukprot:CAMPEP_0115448830 /NCGR_PEP_ID=MMETSP0271-20121206/40688_1 /TAXON_ID=71861 /ORGANISM="Scrippsiella trochoidea, Strain CCMP3099" /LENGTH=156 /DNA_ID=CAMNT_0002874953 /DNA_START=122 /DNA_END=588 /DNA_ORIENTATION=-
MASPSARLPTILESPPATSFTIVVPEGATAGTSLKHTTPDGKELDLAVPPGVPPGSSLILTQDPSTGAWSCVAEPPKPPAAPPAAAPASFTVVVPEDAVPGAPLKHTTPDGKELDLVVPAGVPPGSVLTLTQDPATGGWSCTAEPSSPSRPSPAAS